MMWQRERGGWERNELKRGEGVGKREGGRAEE